jgi:tetratricopeptide (TPR) repeat protein
MAAYARANELAMSNKIPEALAEYQRVLELDPRMGRAYAGMAVLYANTKQADKAEANYQAAIKNLDRMSERERYRTLGTYYMNVAQNQEKAIENYETLVRLYPADDAGHGNLALAYVKSGNVPRAVTEVRKALDIYPKNALQRYNYAMYSMYAGDFDTAIAEATKLQNDDPKFEYFYLPLAISNLARGDAAAAREAWTRLSEVSPVGASFATLGQADADMHLGQHQRATRRLRDGLSADARNRNQSEQARKAVALAEASLALGQRARAVQLATEATTLSRATSTLVPAAFVFVGARQVDKARRVADDLEKLLQRETTSYARLIAALIALENNRLADAIETFRDAQKRYDSWFGRFLLGKAYVQAEHYTEGLAELELAVKRAGETTDVFVDDMPTLRYLPPAYYWLARASEGAGAATQAGQSYERFLSLRAEADPGDPLVVDARKRLAAR